MIGCIESAAVVGIDAFQVRVEVDHAHGLRECHVVGLPDGAIRESVKRVQSAVRNSGYEWPRGRITINLSPAGLRKDGTGFDLPIAVAILLAAGRLDSVDEGRMENALMVGELSLDGSVKPVPGVLPRATLARDEGICYLLVPRHNSAEAAVVDDVQPVPLRSLTEAVAWCQGGGPRPLDLPPGPEARRRPRYPVDFAEVKGQRVAKRALEIAAAGGHNVLMIGAPGTGKTMLARRLVTILPELTFEEAIETTKIYSVVSALPRDGSLMVERPFCAPHFTISEVGIAGGGAGVPRPGQVSLAHNGVLFLDELPEFPRGVLEVLRGPLEDEQVTLTRGMVTVTYPASIMLVGAMNPCPCGYAGSSRKRCECTYLQVQGYRSRISGPLLDRIDLQTTVAEVSYADLVGRGDEEPSAVIRRRVVAARQIQARRFDGLPIHCNAEMAPRQLTEFCQLDAAGHRLMERCIDVLGMSARGYSRLLKVARTIADLARAEAVSRSHLAEAVAYRQLDAPEGDETRAGGAPSNRDG